MTIMFKWLKNQVKRSSRLKKIHSSVRWKLHVLRDWWGTKVWTFTSEVSTPLGFKLSSGLHPAYAMMRNGTFEIEETAIISSWLSKIDVFIDIGANLGYYTCLALQANKTVIAFEPQRQNLQCLMQNLISNDWQNKAEIFPVALGSSAGLLTLYGASGPSASLIKNWAGYSARFQTNVPVSTLDNVISTRFPNKRLFIKIDVEGAEYLVLKGALSTLARTPKPVWLIEICFDEFHPDGINPNFVEIFKLFFSHGYKASTATSEQTKISIDDVSDWVRSGRSPAGTFNYVFSDDERDVTISPSSEALADK